MTVTYIEIDSDKRDTTSYTNPYTFDISTNTSSSTTETGQLIGGTPTTRINTRQYEVRLLELTIPLANRSFLNQPYIYVKFENSRSVDNSHFYSNNLSSAGKYFRVPLDTRTLQTNSIYTTFKSNMTQILNLSLQENLTFDIRLPDNSQVTEIANDTTSYDIETKAAAINTSWFNMTNHGDVLNFPVGSTLIFNAGTNPPTGTYTVFFSDPTNGTNALIGVYPKLDKAIAANVTVQNTSHLNIDRVTALFELKQIVKY